MKRTGATPPLRTPKPQQQTLSVRISDAMRRRVERAKQLSASLTGTDVSTSVIAKQLLESAREDRLVRLLAHPTDALIQTRQKGHGQLLVSRAEWTVLAHVVRHGLEACCTHTPTTRRPARRSSRSWTRSSPCMTCGTTMRRGTWVTCLPTVARRRRHVRADSTKVTSDVVRQTVRDTHRRVSDRTARTPMQAHV